MTDQASPQSDAEIAARLGAWMDQGEAREQQQEQPAAAAPEQEAAPEPVAEEAAAEAPAEEEYAEVDYEGEKYRVPPKLKDALLRQSDYTRKTQEIAETRKMLAEQSQLQRFQAEVQQHLAPDLRRLESLQERLDQFKQVDWAQALDTDPLGAIKLQQGRNALKEEVESLKQEIAAKQQAASQAYRERLSKALEAGTEQLKREIPNWGPDTAKQVANTAREFGFTDSEISSIIDPRLVKLLHAAGIGAKAQAATPSAAQKVAQAPKTIRPGPAQGANAAADQRIADLRSKLSKSGRVEDAAALLAAKFR